MLCGPVAAVHPRQRFLACQLWFREHALSPRLSPLFVVFSISLELPAHFFILVSRHSMISLFIKVQLLLIESSLTLFYSNLLSPSMLRHLSTFQEAVSPPGTLSTVPPVMGEEARWEPWIPYHEESFLRERGTRQYFLCILANRPILYLTLLVLISSFPHNVWLTLQASFELKKISYQEIKCL